MAIAEKSPCLIGNRSGFSIVMLLFSGLLFFVGFLLLVRCWGIKSLRDLCFFFGKRDEELFVLSLVWICFLIRGENTTQLKKAGL